MLPAIVAFGALGAAVLASRREEEDETYGAPGEYMTPERVKAGRPPITDEDFKIFLDVEPGNFRKLFKAGSLTAKAILAAKGLGHLSLNIIRGDMKVMPSWFQKAYASKWFGGSIDGMLTEISAIAGITVPKRA